MSPVTPLHTGLVAGHPVRFFRGPASGPDMPWHALEDLYRALGLPRSLRRHMRQMTQRRWGTELRTIATGDEVVVIAPHFVAQGLVGAASEAGRGLVSDPDRVDREYHREGAKALKALTGDMPLASAIDFAMAAYRGQGPCSSTIAGDGDWP